MHLLYFVSQWNCLHRKPSCFNECTTGQLARKLYECMRREDASLRIQKHARAHTARKAYTELRASAIVIQTGLRAMAAHNEFSYRRRTKASIIIQVVAFLKYGFFLFYKLIQETEFYKSAIATM